MTSQTMAGAFYGAELRHWRKHRNLTQDELGRLTGDSGDLIRKIELAERWPPEGFSDRADKILESNGALARLAPWVSRERQVDQPADPALNPDAWTFRLAHGPIEMLYLRNVPTSQTELIDRLESAQHRVNVFGLTRKFYATEQIREILERTARRVPVRFYLSDPDSVARTERYRIENIEAAMEDPQRMTREVLVPLRDVAKRVAEHPDIAPDAGFKMFLFNFPAAFSIDEIDYTLRMSPYGHGQANMDKPIFVFRAGTPYYDWFSRQLRWFEAMTNGDIQEPWRSKGVQVRPFD
jgi:transcriptional regulator with XRE-family HTH domain